jgi:hypothetical protein
MVPGSEVKTSWGLQDRDPNLIILHSDITVTQIQMNDLKMLDANDKIC